jgi:amino acid transporter
MDITWNYVKKFLKEKCIITIAFFGEMLFELIRITILLIGVSAFLFIADFMGFRNDPYIQMLHQFSIIGFSIIYIIVLVYGIIDFYRIFNKPSKHESIQLNLDEAGNDGNK